MNNNKPKRKVSHRKIWSRFQKATLVVTSICGIAYGALMHFMFQGKLYSNAGDENGLALVAFLCVVPMIIGGISVYLLPTAIRTPRKSIEVSALSIGYFIIFTLVTSSGLIFCVLIAIPFILVFALIGGTISYIWKKVENRLYPRKKKKRYYAFSGFALFLPLLLAPIELQIESPIWIRTVYDEIIINGTPEEVWQSIIRTEAITTTEQPHSIFQTLGIPRPISASLDHEGLGGVRVADFEFGLIFYEEVTRWQPYKSIHFSIDVLHNDESTAVLKHIGGQYFDVLSAGYEIEQLDDGRGVLLRLESDYRLSTHFNGYAAFWSDWIMHDFQTYVLNTAKQRIES